jgi:hypothetical protein
MEKHISPDIDTGPGRGAVRAAIINAYARVNHDSHKPSNSWQKSIEIRQVKNTRNYLEKLNQTGNLVADVNNHKVKKCHSA